MALDTFERTWGHRLSGDESHETEDEQDHHYRQLSPRTEVFGVGGSAESLSTLQQCLGWQECNAEHKSQYTGDTDSESVSHVIPSQ